MWPWHDRSNISHSSLATQYWAGQAQLFWASIHSGIDLIDHTNNAIVSDRRDGQAVYSNPDIDVAQLQTAEPSINEHFRNKVHRWYRVFVSMLRLTKLYIVADNDLRSLRDFADGFISIQAWCSTINLDSTAEATARKHLIRSVLRTSLKESSQGEAGWTRTCQTLLAWSLSQTVFQVS